MLCAFSVTAMTKTAWVQANLPALVVWHQHLTILIAPCVYPPVIQVCYCPSSLLERGEVGQ
jgi:hypothetical protein